MNDIKSRANRVEILRRMRAGDFPLRLDYNRAEFEDGRRCAHSAIVALERAGLIQRPTGSHIGDRFTLVQQEVAP